MSAFWKCNILFDFTQQHAKMFAENQTRERLVGGEIFCAQDKTFSGFLVSTDVRTFFLRPQNFAFCPEEGARPLCAAGKVRTERKKVWSAAKLQNSQSDMMSWNQTCSKRK